MLMVDFDMSKEVCFLSEHHFAPRMTTLVRSLACMFVLMLSHLCFLREPLRAILALKPFDLEMIYVKMPTHIIAIFIIFLASFE